MGGKRLAAVPCVSCLAGGGTRGGGRGEGGHGCRWKAGDIYIYIYMRSLCAGVSHVSFLSIGCW